MTSSTIFPLSLPTEFEEITHLLTARSLGVIVSFVRRFSFKWANMHRWTDLSGGVFFWSMQRLT